MGMVSLAADVLVFAGPADPIFRLIPLKLGERRYLVPLDERLRFCIDLAEGREPRRSAVGRVLLRDGDERKAIPKGLRPTFCREPS
jgi:hypothetical protein